MSGTDEELALVAIIAEEEEFEARRRWRRQCRAHLHATLAFDQSWLDMFRFSRQQIKRMARLFNITPHENYDISP
ncbi:TPA: hypothetical protein N0F65_012945 [Lagenidium giganteum]|uniref:Uncharacterized protein n=1 Tax=Lagenidium giganteum TaxID=4803 RepID=A0AAV2Z2Y2_9STRA|nr:TPA: hypothetical protein N0F65_012945 [Lagenidium giganteum]